MSDLAPRIKAYKWWHGMMFAGVTGMTAVIASPVSDGLDRRSIFLLFLAVFLFGLGQWINRPGVVTLYPGFKVTSYDYSPSLLGFALEALSAVIFIIQLTRLLFAD